MEKPNQFFRQRETILDKNCGKNIKLNFLVSANIVLAMLFCEKEDRFVVYANEEHKKCTQIYLLINEQKISRKKKKNQTNFAWIENNFSDIFCCEDAARWVFTRELVCQPLPHSSCSPTTSSLKGSRRNIKFTVWIIFRKKNQAIFSRPRNLLKICSGVKNHSVFTIEHVPQSLLGSLRSPEQRFAVILRRIMIWTAWGNYKKNQTCRCRKTMLRK